MPTVEVEVEAFTVVVVAVVTDAAMVPMEEVLAVVDHRLPLQVEPVPVATLPEMDILPLHPTWEAVLPCLFLLLLQLFALVQAFR